MIFLIPLDIVLLVDEREPIMMNVSQCKKVKFSPISSENGVSESYGTKICIDII